MDKAFEEIFSRMNDAWFPVNPVLLSRVQAKFASGQVEGMSLLNEIKGDISLFLFTVKELSTKLLRMTPDGNIHPITAFKKASPGMLRSLLTNSNTSISIHEFQSMKAFQADILRNTMISATASETLAPSFDMRADTAYTCALLRRLGLALIAWNYPTVYTRAIEKGTSRDSYLHMVLGFSPSLLAFSIVRKWGLAPEIRRGMGDVSCLDGAGDASAAKTGEMLEKLCHIGEVIAQLENPSAYPLAKTDWDEAREIVEKQLGPTGFRILEKKAAETARYYIFSAPELFIMPTINENAKIEEKTRRSYVERNPHIRGCPDQLREQFEAFYSKMEDTRISSLDVDYLLKEIIPGAGFSGGCIYLVDADYHMLIPRFALGASPLEEFKAIRYSVPENKNNPIVRAFLGNTPIIGESKRNDESWVSYIGASLGYLQRAGVLYLEAPLRAPGSDQSFFTESHKSLCKAIRQALNDCLKLE